MTQTPDPVDTFSMLRPRPGDPPQLRVLRLAVIAMGLALVLGTALVISRIIYLSTQLLPVATPVPAASPPIETVPAAPAQSVVGEARLSLPPGAKVRSQAISGHLLSVHYEAPGGDGIAIMDLSTGRQLSLVRLEPATK